LENYGALSFISFPKKTLSILPNLMNNFLYDYFSISLE